MPNSTVRTDKVNRNLAVFGSRDSNGKKGNTQLERPFGALQPEPSLDPAALHPPAWVQIPFALSESERYKSVSISGYGIYTYTLGA